MESRILSHFFVRNELQRILLRHRGRNFSEITTVWSIRAHFNLRITWHINSVVLIEIERLTTRLDRRLTFQTNQSRFMVVVREHFRCTICGKRDATVMKKTRCCLSRRHGCSPAVSLMSARHITRFLINSFQSNLLTHRYLRLVQSFSISKRGVESRPIRYRERY